MIATLPVDPQPDAHALDSTSLWIGTCSGSAVDAVDTSTARVIARIPVDGRCPVAIAAYHGTVWAAAYRSQKAFRIDPAMRRVVATVDTGPLPSGLAIVGNELWVFNQGDGSATIVDTRTNRVAATVQLGVNAGFVTVALGSIWVPDFIGTTDDLFRIDPKTRAVAARIHIGQQPLELAFGEGSGWVTAGDGNLARFDPTTGAVTARIAIPGGQPDGVAVTPGAVWVTNIPGSLYRVDPATNTIVASLVIGGGLRDVTLAGGRLFVSRFDAGAIAVVTPAG